MVDKTKRPNPVKTEPPRLPASARYCPGPYTVEITDREGVVVLHKNIANDNDIPDGEQIARMLQRHAEFAALDPEL